MTIPKARLLAPLIVIDEGIGRGGWLEGRTRLTKLVFLVQRENPIAFSRLIYPDDSYRFRPYLYGPYSKDLLRDIDELRKTGLIVVETRPLDTSGRSREYLYATTAAGRAMARSVPDKDAVREIRNAVRRYSDRPRLELVQYIYRQYPDAVLARPEK